MRRAAIAIAVAVAVAADASSIAAQTLKGSPLAMQRQHRVARQHDYTLLKTRSDVRRFVSLGLLVPVRANSHFSLAGVSHPHARPALRTFVTRLAAQYHSACGEKLVVTSLTRPLSEQPRNASDLSVHPAGMAADFRLSRKASCRKWLERVLLSLERQGVLDATRERYPAHYHVALFPQQYTKYVARIAPSSVRVASNAAPASSTADAPAGPSASDDGSSARVEYVVNSGDTLWSLARRYGITVDALKELNNLRSSRIDAGQVLTVPTSIGS
jgi:hypothetical protein